MTTVVNLYKEQYDVYIGRAGKGQDGYFGNPYTGHNKDELIARFEEYFYKRIKTDPEFRKEVLKLKNKRLGCFCAPKPCHGDVIAEYLNRLPETKPVKLGVIGSRSFQDYPFMAKILDWFEISEIISGGAKGADSMAKKYAINNGIKYTEFPAEWDKYGKSAGYRRNEKIVDRADEIIAFWDGQSKGTKHSIDLANNKSKPCHIHWPKELTDEEFIMNIGV